jgi:hypothetical protein
MRPLANTVFALIASMLSHFAWAFDPFTIRDIRLVGVQRVEPGTVFGYLPVKVGERLDDDAEALQVVLQQALLQRRPGQLRHCQSVDGDLFGFTPRVQRLEQTVGAESRAVDQARRCLLGDSFDQRGAIGDPQLITMGDGSVRIGNSIPYDSKAAAEALHKVQLPSGRVRLEKHGQGWLLDDSYNANPDSLAAAVATLESLPGKGREVALLGAMAELGSFSRMLHEESGSMIARSGAALCFAVGADSQFLVEAAKKARQGDWARWFANREELLAAYRREAKPDDRILVKGSRSQQMDLVAAELRKGS